MKLVTFKVHTEARVGGVVGDCVIDLNLAYFRYLVERKGRERTSAMREADYLIPTSMIAFLEGGEESMQAAQAAVEFVTASPKELLGPDGEKVLFKLNEVRLKAPIPNPGKIYALVGNTVEHAKEAEKMGLDLSRASKMIPVSFPKFSSSTHVIGPYDPIILPRDKPTSEMVDNEWELCVVIGKRGKYIPAERAYDYVAGYTGGNDVSFRDQHLPFKGPKGSKGVKVKELAEVEEEIPPNDYVNWIYSINPHHWVREKNLDHAAVLGPYIVTKDEVGDPHSLRLTLKVNGEIRQQGYPKLFRPIPEVIEYLSNGVTLEPGDVIFTGSMPGSAVFTGKYLRPGDVVEGELEGAGTTRNLVLADD